MGAPRRGAAGATEALTSPIVTRTSTSSVSTTQPTNSSVVRFSTSENYTSSTASVTVSTTSSTSRTGPSRSRPTTLLEQLKPLSASSATPKLARRDADKVLAEPAGIGEWLRGRPAEICLHELEERVDAA